MILSLFICLTFVNHLQTQLVVHKKIVSDPMKYLVVVDEQHSLVHPPVYGDNFYLKFTLHPKLKKGDQAIFTAKRLPKGLTISQDGVITGRPLEHGSFIISVFATFNTKPGQAGTLFSFSIPNMYFYNTTIDPVIKGIQFERILYLAGGLAPITVIVDNLPSTVYLEGLTLKGKFLNAGQYDFIITIKDRRQQQITQTFTISVLNESQQPIFSPKLIIIPTNYSLQIKPDIKGGSPPYFFNCKDAPDQGFIYDRLGTNFTLMFQYEQHIQLHCSVYDKVHRQTQFILILLIKDDNRYAFNPFVVVHAESLTTSSFPVKAIKNNSPIPSFKSP